jgi:hypothetical protein
MSTPTDSTQPVGAAPSGVNNLMTPGAADNQQIAPGAAQNPFLLNPLVLFQQPSPQYGGGFMPQQSFPFMPAAAAAPGVNTNEMPPLIGTQSAPQQVLGGTTKPPLPPKKPPPKKTTGARKKTSKKAATGATASEQGKGGGQDSHFNKK